LSHELIIIHCDSHGAIHLAKNQIYHERTKHINGMYHLILDIMSKDVVLVKNIDIVENPANMLRKPISAIKFKHCLNLIDSCST
jgi:hypothetical protein